MCLVLLSSRCMPERRTYRGNCGRKKHRKTVRRSWNGCQKNVDTKFFSRHPKRGSKERLLDLAKRNAKMVLLQDAEKLKRERARTLGAMEEIQELLGMSGLHRVESYDISNINGFETVGSMVVFEDGRAKKNDYRKFRIRSVTGPDDYASMEELLTRRFTHGKREDLDETDAFRLFPDVIFMDGGKGQVNICEKGFGKIENIDSGVRYGKG